MLHVRQRASGTAVDGAFRSPPHVGGPGTKVAAEMQLFEQAVFAKPKWRRSSSPTFSSFTCILAPTNLGSRQLTRQLVQDKLARVKLVNVYEARGQFSRLLEEAEAGEEIVIARNGTPVVRLVPIHPPERRLGRWRGQVPAVSDEQWAASDEAVGDVFAESSK